MCVMMQRLYEKIKSLPGSVEISINARSCTSIPFIVPKGKELVWRIQVKDYDLGFAVRLRQQGEGGAVETDLLPLEKISVSPKPSLAKPSLAPSNAIIQFNRTQFMMCPFRFTIITHFNYHDILEPECNDKTSYIVSFTNTLLFSGVVIYVYMYLCVGGAVRRGCV